MLYKCLHDYYAVIICKKDVLKFLKLGEGVKELSRWDRQSKKQDLRFMATTEVFHKPAGVRSSSKITDSFVASFPGLPHIIAFNSVYTHGTFETNSASLGHLSRSGKGFSGVHRFSATIAVRLYSSLGTRRMQDIVGRAWGKSHRCACAERILR